MSRLQAIDARQSRSQRICDLKRALCKSDADDVASCSTEVVAKFAKMSKSHKFAVARTGVERSEQSAPPKNARPIIETHSLRDKQTSVVCALSHEPTNDDVKLKKRRKSTRDLELHDRLLLKLRGSRFRYLNEQLYTTSGSDAVKLFKGQQDLFSIYHEGFRCQQSKWPINPVDLFIKRLKKKQPSLVVADLGCGDARLAASVPQTVHSFDLVALNERVTVAEMSHLPLEDCSIDICIFCLSLMGTNLAEYLTEAHRVCKQGGSLWIAELTSRFTSMKNFRKAVQKLGFTFVRKRSPNDYFVMLDFEKNDETSRISLPGLYLKPCLYKKR